jgi:glycosyltransferase involved in cell wall biosynthesis
MPQVDILLPTCNRQESLIYTLSGVANQSLTDIHLIIADQSDQPADRSPVVKSLLRIIQARGGSFEWHYRIPSLGIAEQRNFLLNQASAGMVLYLDDDVWMEPWVLQKMVNILSNQECSFIGAFPAGLSYRDDVRSDQQFIDFWEGPVKPESVWPDTPEWERAHLHRAANLYHVTKDLNPHQTRLYKIAWIASCILYDRRKVLEVGGYSFWDRLPRFHSGEEVLLQNLLMRRWGGAAMIPSGTYYSEVPSTVLNDEGTVDGHALDLLPEMIEKYIPEQVS